MAHSVCYLILWWDSKSAEYRWAAASAFSFTFSATLVHHTCAKFLHQTHSKQAQCPRWCRRAVECRSGVKVWRNPAFQSKKKGKSHHPTSDVMSECRSNMDLTEQLLACLFPTNTLSTSCYPSFNAPPLHYRITWSHISNYNNFLFLQFNISLCVVYLIWMFNVWLEVYVGTVSCFYLNQRLKQLDNNLPVWGCKVTTYRLLHMYFIDQDVVLAERLYIFRFYESKQK